MIDFEKLKPDQLGTLYDSFKRTVEAYPNNPALRIPKKKIGNITLKVLKLHGKN